MWWRRTGGCRGGEHACRSVRASGDGISFDENKSPTNNNNTGVDKTLSLPKSGKLRLVMDDGTIQEINLARVREATVKP